ncbi:MAG: phospholipid-binding protein MlaC [Candidatus Binatia bacterium]
MRYARFVTGVTVSLLAVLVTRAGAAESPQEMIQTTVQQTLAVLRDPAYQGKARRAERAAKVKDLVLPHFDMQDLAARTLGPYWSQLTASQRQEFVPLVSDLVERSYDATIDQYAQEVQLIYDQQRVGGSFAEVDTRVLVPTTGRSLSLDYFLHLVNGQWLIYDVQIDNVSLAMNYRNQFSRIISASSFGDLVQRIKDKLRDADRAST